MTLDAWYRNIHERLLSGDPVASSKLAEKLAEKLANAVFGRLIRKLRQRFPQLASSEMIDEACADAVMSYIKRPEQFDCDRGKSLFNYLLMSADGDLRNALAKAKRRRAKENVMAGVELESVAGNEESEAGCLDAESNLPSVQIVIERLFDDPTDQRLAEMILDGERLTTAFAAVLGLERLPVKDQRKQVKRHKDRIKKKLSRSRGEIRD